MSTKGAVGTGSMVFAGISMKYYSPDGFTVFSFDSGKADNTADDDTEKNWCAGDKADYGSFTATIILLPLSFTELTIIMDAATAATLTWTSPKEGAGTAGTWAGTAFLNTMDLNPTENGTLVGPATFVWESKPVAVNEGV